MKTGTARGFTLLEVLLAVAITGIVMVTVGTTFRVLLEAREVVDELSESTEAGPRIIHLIERDLAGLWTYDIANNAVFVGTNDDVGSFEADRIDLLTTTDAVGYVLGTDDKPKKPSLCEVGYWLKQNQRYSDLIELWRREDPLIDDNVKEQGSFQLVHDRIKSFKLTYFKTLGHEAEELNEWDSAVDDALPRRIKLEFTIERRRGSRNVVNDAEIEDFEGAEKTYVRHFVLDHRLQQILTAGTAMIPLTPPPPEDEGGGAGPAGPGSGEAGPRGGGPAGRRPDGAMKPGNTGEITVMNSQRGQRPNPGGTPRPPAGAPPPGFNIGDLLRGSGGGQGLGGIFGSGGGRR